MEPGLGTLLRHLIELLDGAVEAAYVDIGLDYRPRFTPVMRALVAEEPLTVGEIAARARITQPSATQTVGLMLEAGWVVVETGTHDARQRLVKLSADGRRILPDLERCWAATAIAAASLDAELPFSLSELLQRAISALEAKPFEQRVASAHPPRPTTPRRQSTHKRSSARIGTSWSRESGSRVTSGRKSNGRN